MTKRTEETNKIVVVVVVFSSSLVGKLTKGRYE